MTRSLKYAQMYMKGHRAGMLLAQALTAPPGRRVYGERRTKQIELTLDRQKTPQIVVLAGFESLYH